eukprot:2029495-Rhodomonas_salina.3
MANAPLLRAAAAVYGCKRGCLWLQARLCTAAAAQSAGTGAVGRRVAESGRRRVRGRGADGGGGGAVGHQGLRQGALDRRAAGRKFGREPEAELQRERGESGG